MKFKLFSIVFINLFVVIAGHSQSSDSLVIPRHRHLKANLTMTAFNVTLNRGNRYFLESGKDWADISWASWKRNLSSLPEWDWDLYTTNWFAHPYQGSMYYNCARSLKMNYVQSMGYALLGSTIWEYLGEDQAPSTNDFIATTTGGILLGEILFRLSENILDDRTYGGKRRVKEIFATLVNPIGGANRFFYNHINQHEEFSNHIHIPVRTKIALSTKYMLNSSSPSNQVIIPEFMVDVEYGEFKKKGQTYKPFEFFWIKSWLRFDKYNQNDNSFQVPLPYLNISSTGIIYGKVFQITNDTPDLWAVFQDYDYLKTYTYAFSSLSFTLGGIKSFGGSFVKSRHRLQAGPVVLAAVQSLAIDQIRPEGVGDQRDYIMGPGYSFKLKSVFETKNIGSLELQYDYWRIFVEPGPEGNEQIHRFNSQYILPIKNNLSLGLSYNYFIRTGNYTYLEDQGVLEEYNSEIQFSCFISLNNNQNNIQIEDGY